MRILISGAAGFLGRRFVEHYDNSGNEIVAVDNFQSPYAKWPVLHNGWKYREDIRNHTQYVGGKYDLMIHMAAPVGGREKIDGDPLFNAESLSIDASVFRWAINNVGTLVYPSSSAVYPVDSQTSDNPVRLQERLVDPSYVDWGKPDQMYGFTKFAGEFLAQKAEAYGLRTICIRPFSGYGPGQSQEYPFPSLMRRIVLREDPFVIWGTGEQVRDFIHVDDIIRNTAMLVDNSEVQGYFPVNLGSGIGTSFNGLARRGFDIEGWEPTDIHRLEDKPTGVEHRVADTNNMERAGLSLTKTLDEGIKEVLEYERQVSAAGRSDGER